MASQPREVRVCTSAIEVRENASKVALRGYAAVFDSESHSEVVRPSAFNRTLAQRDDIRLLVNHEGTPLARTKSGTMRLSVDSRGLLVEVDELDMANPTVQELVSAMRRGDIDQMSFAFEDLTPADQRIDKAGVRQLRDVRLFDVSVVTFPWYEATTTELNELDRAFAELRAGALTPERRQVIIMAMGDITVASSEIEDGVDEDEDDELEPPEPTADPEPGATCPACGQMYGSTPPPVADLGSLMVPPPPAGMSPSGLKSAADKSEQRSNLAAARLALAGL